LREDRRHIQDRDLILLRQTIKTRLNLEMAATAEMIGIARNIKPHVVTLVPEKRAELTTEGGLNVVDKQDLFREAVSQLKEADIFVSLFVDPRPEQIQAAAAVGAHCVELHTGAYAEATSETEAERLFEELLAAAAHARQLGLKVKAGHGLDYRNIKRFRGRKEFEEYSIGHSIISRAVLVGLERAVREMIALINS
jgi:pyridoxine 5-phosphate synthase